MKLDLLTNATVVEIAIIFVSGKSKNVKPSGEGDGLHQGKCLSITMVQKGTAHWYSYGRLETI